MKTPHFIFSVMSLLALPVLSAFSAQPIAAKGSDSCCSKSTPVAAVQKISDRSIYQLDSTWTTDTGTRTNLSALEGRIQVVTMFFANCQVACPLLVHDMKRLEAALPPALRDRVGFALVTFDADRDTPEVLHAYRDRQNLDPKHWTLLRGDPADIQELALVLGVKYKKDPQGQFAHSNLITVLSSTGEIIHQQSGLPQAVEPLLAAIQKAETNH